MGPNTTHTSSQVTFLRDYFFLEKGNEPNVFGFGLLILELIFFESFEEENERRKRSKR